MRRSLVMMGLILAAAGSFTGRSQAQEPATTTNAASSSATAQASSVGPLVMMPLPPGPVIKRAPDFAQWTISFVYAKQEKPASAGMPAPTLSPLQSVTIVKTKNLYAETKVYSNGTKSETWHEGALQFNRAFSGSGQMVVTTPGDFGFGGIDPMLYTDFSQSDFPNLDWPSPSNYVGVKKTKDGQFLVFKGSTSVLFPGVQISSSDAYALIDLPTGLPVKVQNDAVTLNYTYQQAPTDLLALPPEAQQILSIRRQSVQAATKRAPSY
jgi:hypothetical protein